MPLSEDPTALQGALLAEAFHLLLSSGRPVPRATLARAVGCGEAAVDEALAGLERIGRTRSPAAGEVLGSLGLSIEPSPHELLLEVGRRYTWCALDAVGILGALDASGRIRSVSPATGAGIEIGFEQGRPIALGGLVLFIPSATCTSVVDEWRPLVNFLRGRRGSRGLEHRAEGRRDHASARGGD